MKALKRILIAVMALVVCFVGRDTQSVYASSNKIVTNKVYVSDYIYTIKIDD